MFRRAGALRRAGSTKRQTCADGSKTMSFKISSRFMEKPMELSEDELRMIRQSLWIQTTDDDMSEEDSAIVDRLIVRFGEPAKAASTSSEVAA